MSRTTDPHPVRRTMIDDCGAISTARRLEAGGVRSMYPEGVRRKIAAPNTSHGFASRRTNTPTGSSSSGASWKRRSRLDGASDGTSERMSEPRPRIGGMLEDADLDGLLSDSGAERIPQLIKAVGDTPSPPVPRVRHPVERSVKAALCITPQGDTLGACHDLEGT